jgi:hypothetical protein
MFLPKITVFGKAVNRTWFCRLRRWSNPRATRLVVRRIEGQQGFEVLPRRRVAAGTIE